MSGADSPIVICGACGEANARGTPRCARCGAAIGIARSSSSQEPNQEPTPMIGGLRIEAPIVHRLHEGRLSKKSAYALVTALAIAIIVLLQFAPTTAARPSSKGTWGE